MSIPFKEIKHLLSINTPRREIAEKLDLNYNSLRTWIRRHNLTQIHTSKKTLIHNEIAKGNTDAKTLSTRFSVPLNTIYHYKSTYLTERDLMPQYAMSNREIAEALDISENLVAKATRSALNKMRDYCERNHIYEELLEYLDTETGRDYGK